MRVPQVERVPFKANDDDDDDDGDDGDHKSKVFSR